MYDPLPVLIGTLIIVGVFIKVWSWIEEAYAIYLEKKEANEKLQKK